MTPTQFLKNYEAALATQTWQAVAPLVHSDICVTFSNGLTHRGVTAVQQAFERNFALIEDEVYAITETHWVRQTEQFAVCLYTFAWQGLISGKAASGAGRGTSVLVQEAGRWLLLAEHLGPHAAG